MSYNSLIWTELSNTMVFDTDNSNISPGFRFGFPTIEPTYYDSQTGKFAYLMVMPSGARVEFKQTTASNIYETVDSSYLQLKVNTPPGPNQPETAAEDLTLTMTGTDGTQLNYVWKGGAYRCNEIKDTNGNYITVNHDENGLLQSVTDTLGRVVTVNYDTQLYPTSITQTWKTGNGEGSNMTHTYAAFTYTTITINTDFGSRGVYGPPNGTVIKALNKVTFADNSSNRFDYNSYGQVFKISNYAADGQNLLNYVKTDLETPAGQTDCPRFSETRSYVQNFNGGSEVVVHNSFEENVVFSGGGGQVGLATLAQVWMDNAPRNPVSKTWFYAPGNWAEGLSFGTEDDTDGAWQRWTRTAWTQDDPTLAYSLNPRVTESKVGDASKYQANNSWRGNNGVMAKILMGVFVKNRMAN